MRKNLLYFVLILILLVVGEVLPSCSNSEEDGVRFSLDERLEGNWFIKTVYIENDSDSYVWDYFGPLSVHPVIIIHDQRYKLRARNPDDNWQYAILQEGNYVFKDGGKNGVSTISFQKDYMRDDPEYFDILSGPDKEMRLGWHKGDSIHQEWLLIKEE